ncbi:MAG: chaperone NapD [Hyphomicrobiaceae bacterium]|nr:chaperone NapD [Hyphomicrobiaceae bacterium]
MNVIGVLVHVLPAEELAARHALGLMDGVEVHDGTHDGRLVVTATDTRGRMACDSLMAMNHVHGVINTALVFHAFEPELSVDDLPETSASLASAIKPTVARAGHAPATVSANA